MGCNSSSFADEEDGAGASTRPPLLPVPSALAQLRTIPHMQHGSLQLERRGGARGPLIFTCKIYGPVRFRTILYYRAREDKDTGAIHSKASADPAVSLNYKAGDNHPFPGSFTQAMDRCRMMPYMKIEDGHFPILIRTESFTPLNAACSLDQLPAAGSEVNGYMNAHTVFARAQMRSGSWAIEVVEERLWVDGECYLLPSNDEMAAYKKLGNQPRDAVAAAQLRERQKQAQQALELEAQQQRQRQLQLWQQQQQLLRLQQQALAAQQQRYYAPHHAVLGHHLPATSAYPTQLPAHPTQLPAAWPQAAPLQTPFLNGFSAQQPSGPLPDEGEYSAGSLASSRS